MARGDDFNFSDVFETMYGSGPTGGGEEVVTFITRDAGTEDGQTADPVELWSQGCMAYRPADPDDAGKCQVLTAQIGPRRVGIATRDTRSSAAFGALNKGDAAFGSPTGGGMFRANADGSVGFRRAGKDGASDAWIHTESDGTHIFGNEWGQFELGKNGFVVALADGTYLEVKAGEIVLGAANIKLPGTIGLGASPSVPLAPAPITGTVGAGFVSTVPINGIFVTPG